MSSASKSTPYRQFMEGTCRLANDAGHQLELTKTPGGHAFRWSHGLTGETTAHTPAVAFFSACQIYHEISFVAFNPNSQNFQ